MIHQIVITIGCSWPGCTKVLTEFPVYSGMWHDTGWNPDTSTGIPRRVFCREHKHRRFDELDQMEKEVNAIGQL